MNPSVRLASARCWSEWRFSFFAKGSSRVVELRQVRVYLQGIERLRGNFGLFKCVKMHSFMFVEVFT